MRGGVVPQYETTETETWSCLSVPPQALHAERSRRKVSPDREQVRQLHMSIEPPTKGDVCRSRRNVLGSPAIWNNRA